MKNPCDSNLFATAVVDMLSGILPNSPESAAARQAIERAKTALITVDALQNEVVRLLAENERLSERVKELEAKVGE